MIVRAPAKVNLLLSVRPGADASGYHAVETVLVALELADEVSVEETDAPGIALSCDPDPLAGGDPAGNLAHRAAAALAAACGRSAACSIAVKKRIPAQAGLGGGSSDAAAVLRCLARLWGLGPGDGRLAEVAAGLGADVPFFLDGAPGRYTGRGDLPVERFAPLVCPLAVVKPPVGVSTAAAYRLLDELRPAEVPVAPLVDALRAGDVSAALAACGNNMEGAARRLAPAVDEVFAFLGGQPGLAARPLLCGSGSAVAAFTTDAAAADRIAAAAEARGWWSCATSTLR